MRDNPRHAAFWRRVLTVIAGALMLLELRTVHHLVRPSSNSDFAAYYVAASALNAGRSPYDHAFASAFAASRGIHHTRYVYPAVFAAALRPLARLDFDTAAVAWRVMTMAALVAAAVLLATLAGVPVRARPLAVIGAFLWPAAHTTIEIGQVSTLLLALAAAAAWLLMRSSRAAHAAAGGLVGGAVALKTFVMLPLLLTLPAARRWRAAIAAAVVLAVMALAAAMATSDAGGWWHASREAAAQPDVYLAPNQSLPAALDRLCRTGAYASFRFGRAETVVVPAVLNCGDAGRNLGFAASLMVLATTVWAAARCRSAGRMPLAVGLALSGAVVATPIAWEHYAVLLLLPLAVAWRQRSTVPLTPVLAAVVLILVQRYWTFAIYLETPLVLACGCAGALILWTVLVLEAGRAPATRPSPYSA